MAPPSPRRSSRARATNTQSQQSSVSSNTSGRLERNTRSLNKPSSGKSTPSASLSSEPLDDIDDTLLGRRRKRGHEDDQDKPARNDNTDMANDVDEIQEEEDEAVRCICGSEEYPGRPPVDGPDADFFASIELTEDVTGFFVQCDICKVWQHGACVGIFSAESSPDEYFCEQCRKDLHKIHSASNGQKYSKYLPLNRPSRTTSRATSITKDGARSPKLGGSKTARANTISQTSKRRSTMNSRDAAYDDEQLRRAIEASKEETHEGPENNGRRTKRGRSNSEENNTHVKRQRTSSRSASPAIDNTETLSREDSDEDTHARNGQKKPRQSRNQEKLEKEEKERSRQEASTKRKGRAERRRTEGGGFPANELSLGSVLTISDSDLSEELPLAISKSSGNKNTEILHVEPTPAAMPVPGTPPPVYPVAGTTYKRSSRSNHKKGRGKNQHTKDRVADHEESPARSMSRDITKAADEQATSTNSKPANDQKHGSKARSALANKMSMLDMKRRVAAIMDFISKTQIDLAAEAPFNRNGAPTDPAQSSQSTNMATSSGFRNEQDDIVLSELADVNGFKELSCIEMMDVLTRDMVKWQNQYA
ncbi:Putative histone deacetylase complex subunit cti6 [Cladobotryum mycophilum]|uniref:Histone deacetylase complex subunit cti6 n=1 Tax=Cladobotryum mycophilum TaxID=491253 RepID=A0ABR0SFM0_9HYPO